MGIRKSKRDLDREEIANRVNRGLIGTGIHVTGGGRYGPYSVTIDRLNRREMDEIVDLLNRYRYPELGPPRQPNDKRT